MKRAGNDSHKRLRTVAGPSTAAPVAPASTRSALLIRGARDSDMSDVIALDERVTGLKKEAHWKDLYERYRKSRGAGQFFVVATAGDAPARLRGFIVGEIRAWEFGSAPCGWVYALAVDPDTRLHRVGETLLEAISAEFRACGVTKMRTMVARDNRLPMLFFRGEGMMAGPYVQLEKDLT